MSYKPPKKNIDGLWVSVAENWILVKIHGMNEVAILSYEKETGRRVWQTTEIKDFKFQDKQGFVVTRSGTVYHLDQKEKHQSLWEIGLQATVPGLYEKIRDSGLVG